MKAKEEIVESCIQLLNDLISTPSFSKEEDDTATLLGRFFVKNDIEFQRKGNNLWAFLNEYDETKETIWLNSHHDTIKPNISYTKDPFHPHVEDGKLYGLGSNDAGGPLVSLIGAFLHLKEKSLPFNLILIASAEEEISGKNGIASLISQIPPCELAIVGEPTQMQLAVAEKGLMVIDAKAHGKSGHAAREEGENAIYKALDDLLIIRDFEFERISPFLGKTKVSATIINSGKQHNVVPDLCEFTLDVRVTDSYTLEEALEELKSHLSSELNPRSMRLQSSRVPIGHLIFKVAEKLQLECYGSPTLSDQALIPYPSVKIGPGDSARSHTANEFIFVNEIKEGIQGYLDLIITYAELSKTNEIDS
ncbi:M20 family metallo-hydrolase [Algoriphagus sp. CAU 1675]|uniref:M20 family metallo-hydrolase n=1 Tax=Algoriphagus sp. CAU 1675 TaxID=3032597 RepID=UPI0023DC1C50|nr:M20 family metallo-hydrolase [Algoriphagus sp. CAU 1675]MDF2157984.1 M20 family metallo-hydrolase [Algoriphagus sp. CAU 1675]